MDSDNSDNYDQEFWELVEEEFMDGSDEEQQLQNELQSVSSSRPKRRTTVDRGREEGHNRLFNDYFSKNPVYTDVQFRRRFRMHRHVFLRIVDALGNHDEYFQMRVNATGMLGSINCMHWEWKNCPIAWKGQFCRGDHGKPTIKLEAVASQDLWIWHAFFGIGGSNNDINVINQSNVFNDILEGHAPNVQYTVNGAPYNMGYYLEDGIYPEWPTFVKTISMPRGEKKKLFAQHQESAIKDVERAFGVLQSRFAILRGPARVWHMDTLKHTIYTCIILHNMIVEDERHTYVGNFDYSYDNVDDNNSTTETFSGPHSNLATKLQRRASI
ncbi:uncharacterized protein LOC131658422 [Vicia villosa]|uniref:uncharacterized protein LOC131658422 n=1 Tax=Vicia villosa TaxID=3911 RepID=UPI00273A7B7C|nr:uncharacterized protein LOC131658422 [Vicia villosa]